MSLFEDASLIVTPNGFKASKLYSIKPTNGDGDLTVVRATTATRVNSAGLIESVANNVPRLDYTNGSCPSILVEPQRTNLLLRSEEFDNASWGKIRATVNPNVTTSPDGFLNADKLIPNTDANSHFITQGLALTTNQVVLSCFVKLDGSSSNKVTLFPGGSGTFANYNMQNLTFSNEANVLSSQIIDFGNGWYRLISIFPSGLNYNLARIYNSSGSFGADSVAGNGVDGIFIWGAQLEVGSNATSYIPTVASAVTRNADQISKTGVSALIGQTEGTVFIDYKELNYGVASFSSYFSISDGSTSNRLRLIRATTSNCVRVIFQLNGGVNQYDINNLPFLVGQPNKIAFTYKSGDIAVAINGVIVNASTNVLTISDTFSFFGFTTEIGAITLDVPSLVNQVILTDTRMPNAQLEALTTL